MTARTHDAIAFSALVTVAAVNPPESLNVMTVFACMVANIVGSLVPDMDQATNRLWDLFPAGDQLGKIFRRLFFSHRTITHSLLGAFLYYRFSWWFLHRALNPVYVNASLVFWASLIGYISHLVADSMTKEGLPLFFPIRINVGFPPMKMLRIKTGSWVENLIVLPGVGVYVFWFIGKNQEVLLKMIRLMAK